MELKERENEARLSVVSLFWKLVKFIKISPFKGQIRIDSNVWFVSNKVWGGQR
jgi:hypothetical protein